MMLLLPMVTPGKMIGPPPIHTLSPITNLHISADRDASDVQRDESVVGDRPRFDNNVDAIIPVQRRLDVDIRTNLSQQVFEHRIGFSPISHNALRILSSNDTHGAMLPRARNRSRAKAPLQAFFFLRPALLPINL
jgi:hypothetical protein